MAEDIDKRPMMKCLPAMLTMAAGLTLLALAVLRWRDNGWA